MREHLLQKLSPVSKRILGRAESAARRSGHNFLGPEQLLLGLSQEESAVFPLLQALGVTPHRIQEHLQSLVGKGSGLLAVEIPLTPKVYRIISRAIEAAHTQAVEPQHLCLGLLQEGDGVVRRILEQLQVDRLALEHHLLVLPPQQRSQELGSQRLFHSLAHWVESRDLGQVRCPVAPFSLPTGDLIRVDLICSPHHAPKDQPPPIVIDVCSSTKPANALAARMTWLLQIGVQVGLVIDEVLHTVTVYRLQQPPRVLQVDHQLTLPEFFPGWGMEVASLWPIANPSESQPRS
ncbi:MAG: hypothetical protein HC921_20910 [Synechococcaceae cyanobacterium SM2_3_1]|nr:hypothetical protein [Synechococcaceae cyanobacterium SM2_3_1]